MSDTPRINKAWADPQRPEKGYCSPAMRDVAFSVYFEGQKIERELNEAKKDADALAEAIEYTLKADAIMHPETDHVGMRQALETYRNKYQKGKQ